MIFDNSSLLEKKRQALEHINDIADGVVSIIYKPSIGEKMKAEGSGTTLPNSIPLTLYKADELGHNFAFKNLGEKARLLDGISLDLNSTISVKDIAEMNSLPVDDFNKAKITLFGSNPTINALKVAQRVVEEKPSIDPLSVYEEVKSSPSLFLLPTEMVIKNIAEKNDALTLSNHQNTTPQLENENRASRRR